MGRSRVDPAAFYDGGALLPFAGHKGFGLSAMVEALSLGLTGAGAGDPAEGALVICLDAGGFRPESDVRASTEALRTRLHASGQRTRRPRPRRAGGTRARHLDDPDRE